MTNEERDLITQFIQRVGGPPVAAPGGFGGSVPATTSQLPSIDRDADQLMADLFARYPEARYRITQLAFVEEHALVAAQNRISQLTAELQQARQTQAQSAPQGASPWGQSQQAAPQPQPSRGFFGNLFGGGGSPQPQPQPQPQYQPQYQQGMQQAPGYQPGMFQRGGSGFLGSALTTAAGVAGGMVAGNALMGLFEGNHGGNANAAGFGGGGGNAAPWGAPAADPYDLGGAPKDDPAAGGVVDNTAWSTPDQGGGGGWQEPAADPGWTDASADPGSSDGGWTDAGSDDPNNT